MLNQNVEQSWRTKVRQIMKEAAEPGAFPPVDAPSDVPAVDPIAPVDGADAVVDLPKITLTHEMLEKLLLWAAQGEDDDTELDLDNTEEVAPPVEEPAPVMNEGKTKWTKKNKIALKESFASAEEKAAWDQGSKAFEESVIECPPNLGENLKSAWHSGWKSKFVSEQDEVDPADLGGADGEEVDVDLSGDEVEEEINGLEISTIIQRLTDAAAETEDGVVGADKFDVVVSTDADGDVDLDAELNDLELPDEPKDAPEAPPAI